VRVLELYDDVVESMYGAATTGFFYVSPNIYTAKFKPNMYTHSDVPIYLCRFVYIQNRLH